MPRAPYRTSRQRQGMRHWAWMGGGLRQRWSGADRRVVAEDGKRVMPRARKQATPDGLLHSRADGVGGGGQRACGGDGLEATCNKVGEADDGMDQ